MLYTERIKALRENNDYNQTIVANNIHVAQTTYSDYEKGKVRIPIESLIELAKFYNVDMVDKEALDKVFAENKFDAVIHFAGLKAVGESVQIPLEYYKNNLNTIINLLDCMKEFKVNNLVFSSSFFDLFDCTKHRCLLLKFDFSWCFCK